MSSVSRAARQSLVWLLVLIIALGGGIAFQALVKDEPWTPGLALDLAGGAQITLRAVPIDGEEITPEVLQQSVEIIRRRVDASGVAESEITTSGTDVTRTALRFASAITSAAVTSPRSMRCSSAS